MLNPAHDRIIRAYLAAKDENRPYLLASAFAEDSRFEATYEFDSDFPQNGPAVGLRAVTDTFRALGAMAENIFTVCTRDSVVEDEGTLACKWVVAMSEREAGVVRVGWGGYAWDFDERAGLATRLHVTMSNMVQLDPAAAGAVFGWMSALPLPWCETSALLRGVPQLVELEAMKTYMSVRQLG